MRTIEIGAKPLPYLTCKLLGRFFPALYWSPMSNVRLREVPEPKLLGADWVKVRPILSGVCASDLAGVTLKHSFDSFMSAFASFPIGLGHEVVGRVVEVGESGCPSADGREVSVGDRVNLDPYLHCRIRGIDPPCPSCQRGETATCQNFHEGKLPPGTGIGSNNFTRGTWSDGFLAHRLQLIPVPDGVTDEQAALVDPVGCSLHAVTKQFPADGDTVIVYGCGTLGLGILACLRALGSRARLLAIARYDFQGALARQFGADEVLVGLPTRTLFDRVAQLTGGKVYTGFLPTSRMLVGGADVVFDSVGSTETLGNAMKFTRPHGTLVVLGIGYPKRVDWTPVWLQEMRILGTLGQGVESWRGERLHTSVLVHRLIQEGRLNPTPMLTHRFNLSDYGPAFATVLDKRRSHAVKVAFAFS
jgi:threonine dehydrogenase-like Zn-dependent dehydrogenase